MEPLLSVIVPVYKAEKYLHECVSSILNQTYHALDVILVDDGSPDDCGNICDEFALQDSRVQVIHQPNRGQAMARNAGLEHAKGQYITFVDSDDLLDRELYSTVMSASPFEMVIFGCTTVDVATGEKNVKTLPTQKKTLDWCEDGSEISNLFRSSLYGYAWNKVYHRAIVQDLRFADIKLREDLYFNIEAGRLAKRIAISQCAGYYYRIHSESTLHGTYHGPVPEIAGVAERFVTIHPEIDKKTDRAIANNLIKTYVADALRKYVFLNSALSKADMVQEVKKVLRSKLVRKCLRFYREDGNLFHIITLGYKICCPTLLYYVLKRIWK